MRDNSNDLCWVKYLKRVQFEKNTTFHSTVGMTPYEAVYHHKPSYGLSDFGIPVEYGSEIHTEQELDALIEAWIALSATLRQVEPIIVRDAMVSSMSVV